MRKSLSLYIYTICFFLLPISTFAQNPEWLVYNTSNSGLPSNRISAIAIDKSGNKWIGTEGGGLVKFDGKNWIVYNTLNSGLPVDTINSITIDDLKNIWIAAGTNYGRTGIAKFNGADWTLYNPSNSGLPHCIIKSLNFAQNLNM